MKEKESKEQLRIAEGLMKTFVNRRDCYAVQTDDGRYFSVKEALTPSHLIRHLKGEITLGVYLLGLDGTAKYAVIDADDNEGFVKLVRAQSTLRFPSYLERSRRGAHLWYFFPSQSRQNKAKILVLR